MKLKNNKFFIETPNLNNKIEEIISLAHTKHQALMVYADEAVGKNQAFKNALNKLDGNKIIIDFSDKSYLSNWPGYVIIQTILMKLKEFGIDFESDFPDVPKSYGALDVEETLNGALGILKRDLYNLKLDKPLYILFCHAELAFENDFSKTFVHHFIFDKRDLPANLYAFIITSNKLQRDINSRYLEIVDLKDNEDDAKEVFKKLINKYEIEVSSKLIEEANPNLKIRDYIYIVSYLKEYCGEKEYLVSLRSLLNKNNTDELLLEIFNNFYNRLSKFGRMIFTEALLDLYMFNCGLSIDYIINSGRYILGYENYELKDYNEITEEEKGLILSYLNYFTEKEDNRLIISGRVIKEFIGNNALMLNKLATLDYKERLDNAVDYIYKDKETFHRYKYEIYRNVFEEELIKQGRYDKKNLVRFGLFLPLAYRLYDVIKEYAKNFDDEANYDRKNLRIDDVIMLSYIDGATAVISSSMLDKLLADIISEKHLMYYIFAKSRRLARRIITRYIDSYVLYQKRVNNIDKEKYNAILVEYEMRYLTSKDDNPKLEALRMDFVLLVSQVMYECDFLNNNSIFKDSFNQYSLTPITDFVILYADEALASLYEDIEGNISDKKIDFKHLKESMIKAVEIYQDDDNVYHKIICAALAFKAFITLGDNKKTDIALGEKLMPIMEDIMYYVEYVYFPEVYGIIYLYFGRIYAKDYLERLKAGLDVLKDLGYNKTIANFQKAYAYFSSLKGGK